MRRGDARERLEAAREWHARGLLSDAALGTLEQELQQSAQEDRPGLAMQTFYALGGLLLGGATAALYWLLRDNHILSTKEEAAWIYFLVWSVVGLGIGVALSWTRDRDLRNTALLAGLVPTAILLGPSPPGSDHLDWIVVLLAAGVLAWRHSDSLVPTAALALLTVAVPTVLMRTLDDATGPWAWFVLAAAATATGLALRNPYPWRIPATVAAAGSTAVSWVFLVVERFRPDWTGGEEALIAIILAILITGGLLSRDRATLYVGGIGVVGDAVVFAFDVGGATWGLITLLVLGVGLVAAATLLRRANPS